ncbi:MAG: TIGR02391 family protein [Acholeplasmataceae bacterium]|nr:TIGR02391 family protein [Acholeplasmataceae bacterium]
MDIRHEVDVELWNIIKKNYEAENYSGSILDAIFRLTDIIRNKTGLEGDGASLIGQAFGGDNPRIKLNKLQTDSEKDVQKGIQEILRGIYTSIRNPRSHDAIHDKKAESDAIILFINYLLNLIDQSKLSFEEDDFLQRIFDKYYVKSEEYSNLLVSEIPARQRVNIAISIILNRKKGDIYALGFFLEALFSKLDGAEISSTYKVISDELKTTTSEEDIRYLVHICPGALWGKIEKAVRLRIEGILFEDFSNGTYNSLTNRCGIQGSLATWITEEHFQHFSSIAKWTERTVGKLESNDEDQTAYIYGYFWSKICSINKVNIQYSLKNYIKKGLQKGNQTIIDKLKEEIIWDESHTWWKEFEEELRMYPDIKFEDFPF